MWQRPTTKSILLLCVANSARSPMAEGLARMILGPSVPAGADLGGD